MMDLDPLSTWGSSEIETISISDEDNEEKEEKIIEEAEKKISKCSSLYWFEDLCLLLADNLEKKAWHSIVYAFFREWPKIVRKVNWKGIWTTYLEFHCLKCPKSFLRGTGTDSRSTSVMHDHIPVCWGKDVWNEARIWNWTQQRTSSRSSRQWRI